jgi:2-keto-4-pentenoate hydratase
VDGLTLLINDERRAHTDAPWTMGNPMTSLRWLAARLGERGLGLSRGQTILTGSPLPLSAVIPGSRIAVEAPPLERIYVDVDP